MKPRLKSSRAARELIKTHEPFLGDAVARGRRWVLGFGHTAAARQGARISRDDAELLLLYDVIQAEQAIDKAVGEDLPGPVRDALVSFACSIGPGAFKVSDVARLARDGRHLEAAAALETWVRAEEDGRLVVSERLVRRRAAEKALYLQGLQDEPAAPPAPVKAEPAPQVEPAPAPRLGPLVDLELEFVDPPEPAGMIPAEDEADAAPPAPQADADALPAPVEEAPEEVVAEAQPEPAPAPAADEQTDPTGSVIARMNAQMAETLAVRPDEDVPADAEPDAPEPVREGTRLGFSFLGSAREPVINPARQPVAQPAPEPAEEPARPGFKVGPVPVYAAVSKVTVTRTDLLVPVPMTGGAGVVERAEAPAQSTGFSGEVQAVGRPPDMPEEDENGDADEIHPGVLTGSAAPAPGLPQPGPAPAATAPAAAGGGTWLFAANLAVGVVMTGFGLWTIMERGADPEIVDFGLLGPVAAAMGIALTVTSAWILITRKRTPSAAKPAAPEAPEDGPPASA